MGSENFELFEAQKRPRKLDCDEVSLGQSYILISEALVRKLSGVRKVVLLYNRHAQEIGIRAATQGENAYKLSGRAVTARSFYQHFGIAQRGRFQARVLNGMLVIPLKPANP